MPAQRTGVRRRNLAGAAARRCARSLRPCPFVAEKLRDTCGTGGD